MISYPKFQFISPNGPPEIREEAVKILSSCFSKTKAIRAMTQYENGNQYPTTAVACLTSSEEVAGVEFLEFIPDLITLHISWFGVTPAYQNLGYARHLWEFAWQYTLLHGYQYISCYCQPNNAARFMWEHFGMEQVSDLLPSENTPPAGFLLFRKKIPRTYRRNLPRFRP